MVAPPMVYVPQLNDLLYNEIDLGAQNVSHFGEGAYTGCVNAKQLNDMDVPWTIVGHSERRLIMGETTEDVTANVKEAMKNNVKVIYCVSQTAMDRELGPTHVMNGLRNQVMALIETLTPQQWANIVIAFEPIWAYT